MMPVPTPVHPKSSPVLQLACISRITCYNTCQRLLYFRHSFLKRMRVFCTPDLDLISHDIIKAVPEAEG